MKVDILENKSLKQMEITKVKDDDSFPYMDDVCIEEPLEIRIVFNFENRQESKNISVTMRSPGHDVELAIGFLFTEGIISNYQQISDVKHLEAACSKTRENIIIVQLVEGFVPQLMKTERNFYTTSSCGVCGKGSIESIRTISSFRNIERKIHAVMLDTLYHLSEKLLEFQNNFSATGGIHASAIFDLEGNILNLREDVGRHNALDKLIGHALLNNAIPLENNILVLSGRASFELIQKAAMAGIFIVAAIGAPSSLAVELAKEFDITLLGFLRNNRFNVYHSSNFFKIIDKR